MSKRLSSVIFGFIMMIFCGGGYAEELSLLDHPLRLSPFQKKSFSAIPLQTIQNPFSSWISKEPPQIFDSLVQKEISDIEDLFKKHMATTEVFLLAHEFFNEHGLDTQEPCGALKELILKWEKQGVPPPLLLNVWILTKLSIADNRVIDWLSTTESFHKKDIEKADFPRILTPRRIDHLIRVFKINPLVSQIFANRWSLALIDYRSKIENLSEERKKHEGLYEKLVSYQKMRPDLIDLEEVRIKKEEIFKLVRAEKKRILKTNPIQPEGLFFTLLKALPRTLEAVVDLIYGNVAYWGGGMLGLGLGKNWEWSQAGVEVIEFNRWLMNEYVGGSILGTDEQLSDSSGWEMWFQVNPLVQLVGVTSQALLQEADELKDSYYKGVLGYNTQELLAAKQQSRYLQIGDFGFDTAKAAVGLMVTLTTGSPASQIASRLGKVSHFSKAAKLAAPVSVSAGMGTVSSLGQELYLAGEPGKEFQYSQWLRNAYKSTSESLLFMGGISKLGSSIVKQGNYSMPSIQTAQTTARLIDIAEGSSDMPQTIKMIRKSKNLLQALGAGIILTTNAFDTADISVSGIVKSFGKTGGQAKFLGPLEKLTSQEKEELEAMWAHNGSDEKLPPGVRGYRALERIEETLGYRFTDAQKSELAQHIERAHHMKSNREKARYLLQFLPKEAVFRIMREKYVGLDDELQQAKRRFFMETRDDVSYAKWILERLRREENMSREKLSQFMTEVKIRLVNSTSTPEILLDAYASVARPLILNALLEDIDIEGVTQRIVEFIRTKEFRLRFRERLADVATQLWLHIPRMSKPDMPMIKGIIHTIKLIYSFETDYFKFKETPSDFYLPLWLLSIRQPKKLDRLLNECLHKMILDYSKERKSDTEIKAELRSSFFKIANVTTSRRRHFINSTHFWITYRGYYVAYSIRLFWLAVFQSYKNQSFPLVDILNAALGILIEETAEKHRLYPARQSTRSETEKFYIWSAQHILQYLKAHPEDSIPPS